MEILRDAQNHMTHDANVLGTMVKQLFSPGKKCVREHGHHPGGYECLCVHLYILISIINVYNL